VLALLLLAGCTTPSPLQTCTFTFEDGRTQVYNGVRRVIFPKVGRSDVAEVHFNNQVYDPVVFGFETIACAQEKR
jgi:hypothetical protein